MIIECGSSEEEEAALNEEPPVDITTIQVMNAIKTNRTFLCTVDMADKQLEKHTEDLMKIESTVQKSFHNKLKQKSISDFFSQNRQIFSVFFEVFVLTFHLVIEINCHKL